MSTEQHRILVPIDAHGVDRNTLEILVAIADKLGRGLLGLVLDSPRLHRVAELPFTTEIVWGGAQERNLHRDQLSAQRELSTSAALQLLGELAQRNRVSLSFEHASGERLPMALTWAGQLDIFVPRRRRWHEAAASYLPYRWATQRLGVLLSGGHEDAAVSAVAAALLALGQVDQVYLHSRRPPSPALRDALSRPGVRLCVQARLKAAEPDLTELIAQSPYQLLILPRDLAAEVEPAQLDRALEATAAQVLIVHAERETA